MGDEKRDNGAAAIGSPWFAALVALFVACLIAANVLAVKLILVGGLVMTAGIIVFPISYIVGDVITEVYGYRAVRRVIWYGVGANALVVVAIWAAQALPSAPFWQDQPAFDAILGQVPRIVAASLIAYLVGEFANAYVLARMKVAMEGRHLWLRAIASTFVGQGLDSAVFMTAAFAGIMPWPVLAGAILTQWLVKCGYEALATPLTCAVCGFLKRREGVDAYDRDIRFTPLSL